MLYIFVNYSGFLNIFRLCFGGELFDKISEEQYFSEKDAASIIK